MTSRIEHHSNRRYIASWIALPCLALLILVGVCAGIGLGIQRGHIAPPPIEQRLGAITVAAERVYWQCSYVYDPPTCFAPTYDVYLRIAGALDSDDYLLLRLPIAGSQVDP